MNSGSTIIYFTFFLLAVICAWNFIDHKRVWLISILILVTIYLAIGIQFALPRFAGWPTFEDVPETAIVISVLVDEPTQGNKGAIYLWLSGLKEDESEAIDLDPREVFKVFPSREPRAYALPYSRKLHEKISKAQRQAAKQKGIMRLKKDEYREGEDGDDHQNDDIKIEILNPTQVLKKNE